MLCGKTQLIRHMCSSIVSMIYSIFIPRATYIFYMLRDMTKDSIYFLGNITRIAPTLEDTTLGTINMICLNFTPFPPRPEANML